MSFKVFYGKPQASGDASFPWKQRLSSSCLSTGAPDINPSSALDWIKRTKVSISMETSHRNPNYPFLKLIHISASLIISFQFLRNSHTHCLKKEQPLIPYSPSYDVLNRQTWCPTVVPMMAAASSFSLFFSISHSSPHSPATQTHTPSMI